MKLSELFRAPKRDYIIIAGILIVLGLDYLTPAARPFLMLVAAIGALPTAWKGVKGLMQFSITIEGFNFVALAISFGIKEYRSAAFIVLMLAFASLLEWRTESRTENAVTALLALKPRTALLEKEGETQEVQADALREGDIIVIATGARVPADGVVVHGSIYMNEAPVTGESVPVVKEVGDPVFSGTLGDSGVVKVRVTRVGSESTLERMAALIAQAAENKSRTERIADRFASIFLPAVLIFGAFVYYVTRSATVTASIFLVACADDMAVAIPLAVSAAIGSAAKRGVVIKGGEWLDVLRNVKSVVLDKTGTLTYGSFSLTTIAIEKGVDVDKFWKLVGSAERYSEHPVGRAIYKEAFKRTKEIPEHDEIRTLKGVGVWVKVGKHQVIVGDDGVFAEVKVKNKAAAERALVVHRSKVETAAIVIVDGTFIGSFGIADKPRPEARHSLQHLRDVGVEHIAIFTGDNAQVAQAVAGPLGVNEVFASLSPEDKLKRLETMPRPMAMVGDGINDAPALARADVGIAMGGSGTAVAVEAADIVILTDNLSRLSEMVLLGRRTASVIRWDIIIWVATNVLGFTLALTGIIGPAMAAFYNFVTDFFPLMNSARLFKDKKS